MPRGRGGMMNKREKREREKGREGRKVLGRNRGTISPEGTSCPVCPLHTNAFPIAARRSHQGYRRTEDWLANFKGRLWMMYNVCARLPAVRRLFIRQYVYRRERMYISRPRYRIGNKNVFPRMWETARIPTSSTRLFTVKSAVIVSCSLLSRI